MIWYWDSEGDPCFSAACICLLQLIPTWGSLPTIHRRPRTTLSCWLLPDKVMSPKKWHPRIKMLLVVQQSHNGAWGQGTSNKLQRAALTIDKLHRSYILAVLFVFVFMFVSFYFCHGIDKSSKHEPVDASVGQTTTRLGATKLLLWIW